MKKSGFYTLARSLFVPRLDELRQFENLIITFPAKTPCFSLWDSGGG